MVSGELIRIHWDTLGYIGIRLVNQDTLGGIVIVNLDTEEGTASNIWGPPCQSAALSAQPKKKYSIQIQKHIFANKKIHICKYKIHRKGDIKQHLGVLMPIRHIICTTKLWRNKT